MTRILVLSSRMLYPLTDGGRIRRYNTAKILNQEYTVDLLIIGEGQFAPRQIKPLIEQYHEVNLFQYPSYRFYLNTLRGLISQRPLQTFYFSFRDVHRWIDEHKEKYDLFYCNHVRTAQYVRHLDTPKVVDLIDAASRKYTNAGKTVSRKWRLIYPIERGRMLRYERNIIKGFDHAFLVSSADKRYLEASGRSFSSLSVVPNGVRERFLEVPPTLENKGQSEKNWIVFLGSMKYPPNIDATRYFANEVFPKVRDKHPNVKFLIVGKDPTKEVQKLGKIPGIRVTGFVKDPVEYLARARVIVAPIRFGTGIQNKVLEAMALAKPVVTTPLGREGIEADAGTHFRIGATPKDFAAAVNTLLDKPEERQRLGRNARSLTERKYTWENIRPKILTPIQKLLER